MGEALRGSWTLGDGGGEAAGTSGGSAFRVARLFFVKTEAGPDKRASRRFSGPASVFTKNNRQFAVALTREF